MAFGFGKSRRRRELVELEDDDVLALIEPGVELEGKLKLGSGMIRLNSHIKGQIISEGTVIVADQGEVEGEIRTKLISITGKVKGTIYAQERLEIKEHGVVLGNIYTPCLIIDPGAYFDGQCHMPTPEPAKQATDDLDTKDHL